MYKIFYLSIIMFFIPNIMFSQNNSSNYESSIAKPINLSGPRLGFTLLSTSFIAEMNDRTGIELEPIVSQFGWQFEKRFFSTNSGATLVTEWILLVGGVEQELFLPSLSWLIGYRTKNGFEFGAGPNLAISGSSLVLAAGITVQSEELNIPINLAVAISKSGARVSLLCGFNLRN